MNTTIFQMDTLTALEREKNVNPSRLWTWFLTAYPIRGQQSREGELQTNPEIFQ